MSSNFRECVRLVLDKIGMPGAPASYVADVERLQAAASEWFAGPEADVIELELPELLNGQLVTGDLPQAIAQGWAKNDAARRFIRFIDERSGRQATLLMLQIVVLIQQATQDRQINTRGGAT